MSTYELARVVARMLLRGRTDKAERPTFEHACRVAEEMPTYGEAAVALLHDVLEESQATAEDLLALGIPRDMVADVVALTRGPEETYAEYIRRVASSGEVAIRVKLADLEDNLSPERCGSLPDSLRVRYARARETLKSRLQGADS